MKSIVVEAIRISAKRTLQYPFECCMLSIHILFQFLFLLIFWGTIMNTFALPDAYTPMDMYLFNGLVLISSAVSECFSGAFSLPYSINTGELDMYIIKPQKTIAFYMLDHINVFVIAEELIVSGVYCSYIYITFYDVQPAVFAFSVFLLVIGAIAVRLVVLLVSLLSFWIGITEHMHTLLNSFFDAQKYPLGFFSSPVKKFFIFVLPLGLISYFPFEILLGHMSCSLELLAIYALMTIGMYLLYLLVKKKGWKQYESNN